jgi:hypothetical protein
MTQTYQSAALKIPASELPLFKELCFSQVLSNDFIRSEFEGMEAGYKFQTVHARSIENMTLHIMLSNADWTPIINWARLKYPHWFE